MNRDLRSADVTFTPDHNSQMESQCFGKHQLYQHSDQMLVNTLLVPARLVDQVGPGLQEFVGADQPVGD